MLAKVDIVTYWVDVENALALYFLVVASCFQVDYQHCSLNIGVAYPCCQALCHPSQYLPY